MCMQFSADGLVWSEPVATINGPDNTLQVGQGHAKPGIVAVPGTFISSQTLLLCPTGVEMARGTGAECAGLTFDAEGAALTYAVVFAAGSLPAGAGPATSTT